MLPRRYHPSLRILHWLIAALTLAALFFGTFVMARMDNSDPGKNFALLKHMLTGSVILALTLMRLFIRPRTERPAPVLSGITAADRIVPYVHRVFDILILVMVGSGVVTAILTGLPGIVFLGRGVLPESFNHLTVHAVHVFTARLLAGVIALHVAGAFYHQFILRDGLLSRMSVLLGK